MLDLLHNSIFKLANEGHFPVLEDLLLLLLIHKNQFKKNLSGLEFVLNTIVFSSPGLKAQVSFYYHILSVIRPSICL